MSNSAALKARWADPEYRERISAATKAACNTPEAKKRQSDVMKARWEDPAWRAKMAEVHTHNSDPEVTP